METFVAVLAILGFGLGVIAWACVRSGDVRED